MAKEKGVSKWEGIIKEEEMAKHPSNKERSVDEEERESTQLRQFKASIDTMFPTNDEELSYKTEFNKGEARNFAMFDQISRLYGFDEDDFLVKLSRGIKMNFVSKDRKGRKEISDLARSSMDMDKEDEEQSLMDKVKKNLF